MHGSSRRMGGCGKLCKIGANSMQHNRRQFRKYFHTVFISHSKKPRRNVPFDAYQRGRFNFRCSHSHRNLPRNRGDAAWMAAQWYYDAICFLKSSPLHWFLEVLVIHLVVSTFDTKYLIIAFISLGGHMGVSLFSLHAPLHALFVITSRWMTMLLQTYPGPRRPLARGVPPKSA